MKNAKKGDIVMMTLTNKNVKNSDSSFTGRFWLIEDPSRFGTYNLIINKLGLRFPTYKTWNNRSNLRMKRVSP